MANQLLANRPRKGSAKGKQAATRLSAKASAADRLSWFRDARMGLFCHLGLYSLLERGEWVMNREAIPHAEYQKLADQFTLEKWDADAYTQLAVDLGAKYIIFTAKHHEGYCLFDSKLTDFTSVKRGPRRDLVAEVVKSARKRGLKIALYYSLNDWGHNPSGLDALEDRQGPRYREFIRYIHGQVRELMTNYGRIDVMWYDGWWPFDADGWQARKLNAMVRKLQPHILFNNRNCLPGDFGTPEQHLTPDPNRWFEACFTLNDHWGFARNDTNWKSPRTVIDMIIKCARFGGNLAINIGPRGDGSIPEQSVRILREVGQWVKQNEESLRPHLLPRPQMDWTDYTGPAWSAREGVTYMHVTHWPPHRQITINGLSGPIDQARFVHSGKLIEFRQTGDRLELLNLPTKMPVKHATVIALEHQGVLSSYQTGGMRVPRVEHCQYDPVDPNLPTH